jgi:hypothetical protein
VYAFPYPVFKHGPEIADRCALKQEKEEINGREDKNNCEVHINDDLLVFLADEP